MDPGPPAQPPALRPGRAEQGNSPAARRPQQPALQEAARLPAQCLRFARRPGAAAPASSPLRHQPLEGSQGQHRLPRRVRGPPRQRAAPTRRRQDRRARHRQPAGVLRVEPACRRRRGERRARWLHHDGRAHAGIAPRPPGVDAGQAHRVGLVARREHRRRGDLDVSSSTSQIDRHRAGETASPSARRARRLIRQASRQDAIRFLHRAAWTPPAGAWLRPQQHQSQ